MSFDAYPGWVFDVIISATLLWLAVRVLAETRLFKAVVLFIALGLLVALAWVRLSAPDIALAEAAIGAGVTGVLLLDAVGHMRGRAVPYATVDDGAIECATGGGTSEADADDGAGRGGGA